MPDIGKFIIHISIAHSASFIVMANEWGLLGKVVVAPEGVDKILHKIGILLMKQRQSLQWLAA